MPQKILIADDEQSIVIPLQFLLEQNHFTVMAVYNGGDAMKAVFEFGPDLILLDIMLPDLDGFEICQRIRENADFRDMKIVFLSAVARDVDIAKGMALGADAYITKPFSNAKLLARIKELLTG